MFLILDFRHCFYYMRLHRVTFKVGFCQQTCLGKYFRIAECSVVSFNPRTPSRITVEIISSYITKKINNFIGIIITFYTLAAKLVEGFDGAFFFFNLRHSEKLVNSYGKHLGNSRDEFKIGIGRAVLPTADRLIAHAQPICKRLLCQVVFLSKIADIFSNCKFHFFLRVKLLALQSNLFVDIYIIQQINLKINNALREKNYRSVLYF